MHKNQELLQLFIEYSPAALAMFDREMCYLAASKRYFEQIHDGDSNIIGHCHYEYFPSLPDHIIEAHHRGLAGETVSGKFERFVAPDGSFVWNRWEVRPWLTAEGTVGGILLLVEDVTEFWQSEEALSKSKKLLQLFVEHAPAEIAMFDREMRYLAASKRWIDHIHGGDGSVVGRYAYEVNPWLPEHWRESHRKGLAGETVRKDRDRTVLSDGSIVWTRWEVRPWRNEDAKIGGIIIITEDITESVKSELALRESRELLQLFMENAPAPLAMFDREMRYLAVSKRWLTDPRHRGGTSVIGRIHYEVFPDLPPHILESHRRGLAGETLRKERDRIVLSDGSIRWSRWEVRPWWTGEGEVGGILVFSEDITDQVLADERQLLAAQVFSSVREGIFITNGLGEIVEVNESFTRITEYARDEVLGLGWRFLNSGKQTAEFYDEMARILTERGQWSGELRSRKKNGSAFIAALNITVLRDEAGSPRQYVGSFSDITVQKDNERKLKSIAHYDTITGLPNRVLLADRLHQAMVQAQRRGVPLAVAYLDLDGFKAVNDTHGHATGDQLLAELASRMKQALRQGDTLARLGGDEFVAVLLDLNRSPECDCVLCRLLEAAAEPVELSRGFLRVTASLGVTFYPQTNDVDADQLLRQADQAMYQAKISGRNCYRVFDPSVRGSSDQVSCF